MKCEGVVTFDVQFLISNNLVTVTVTVTVTVIRTVQYVLGVWNFGFWACGCFRKKKVQRFFEFWM
jgi:hypothetical protein